MHPTKLICLGNLNCLASVAHHLAWVVFLGLSLQTNAHAQFLDLLNSNDLKTEGAIEINGEIQLTKQSPQLAGDDFPFRGSLVIAEPLEIGKKYLLKLRMVNTSQEIIAFDRLQASCGCAGGRFPAGALLPGSAVQGEILMSIPANETKKSFMVQFFNQKSLAGVITISVEVAGHLSFKNNREDLVIVDGIGEWSIAGEYSRPVDLSRLQLETTDGLRDVTVSTVAGDDKNQFKINLVASAEVIGTGGLSGELKIIDPGLENVQDSVLIVVRKLEPIVVSPTVLILKDNHEDPNFQEASLLVNLRPTLGEAEPSAEQGKNQMNEKLTNVRVFFGEELLKTSSVLINERLMKITVTVPKTLLSQSEASENESQKNEKSRFKLEINSNNRTFLKDLSFLKSKGNYNAKSSFNMFFDFRRLFHFLDYGSRSTRTGYNLLDRNYTVPNLR